jgi:DNA-binding MarR family transcriptional regulator
MTTPPSRASAARAVAGRASARDPTATLPMPMPLHDMPGHLLRRLHQHAVALYAAHAVGIELTPVQYAALHAIGAWPDSDQSSIGRAIACDKATLGTVLDRLQGKGLVERSADANDRRTWRLRATPTGLEVLAQLEPRVAAVQRELLSPLSGAEARELTALLAKLVQALPGSGEAR